METSGRVCSGCGAAIALGSPFCSACGAAQVDLWNVSPAKKGIPTIGKVAIAMVVVFLLAPVLAVVIVPSLLVHADSARMAKVQVDFEIFMTALTTYKQDTGGFPTTEQGFRALREMPPGVSHWAGPYIQAEMPKDPWGRDYVYKYPGDEGPNPDIISLGADGQPGGDGFNADIVSWKKN